MLNLAFYKIHFAQNFLTWGLIKYQIMKSYALEVLKLLRHSSFPNTSVKVQSMSLLWFLIWLLSWQGFRYSQGLIWGVPGSNSLKSVPAIKTPNR